MGVLILKKIGKMENGVKFIIGNYKRSLFFLLLVTFSFSSKFHSLLIPGLGEYKNDNKNHSLAFFVAESCLWLGLYYTNSSSQWYENDYIAFAQLHGSTSLSSRSNQYYINLSNYDNIYEYNTAMQQQRNPGAVYNVNEFFWDWDNSENQRKYSSFRYNAGLYNKYAKFLAAGLVINRIVSFINMLYLEKFDKTSNLKSQFTIENDHGINLNLSITID